MWSKTLPKEEEMPLCCSTFCSADPLSNSTFLLELLAEGEAEGLLSSSLLPVSLNIETSFEDSAAFVFI